MLNLLISHVCLTPMIPGDFDILRRLPEYDVICFINTQGIFIIAKIIVLIPRYQNIYGIKFDRIVINDCVASKKNNIFRVCGAMWKIIGVTQWAHDIF